MKRTYFEGTDSKLITSEKKEEREKLRKEKFPEEKLAELLEEKMLKKDILVSEALRCGYDVIFLGLLVISQSDLQDIYINYKNSKQNENFSDEDVLFSFLEKIQQPEKVEKELEVVDVPETLVAPITSPKEELQTVVEPAQASETPNLEPIATPEIILLTQQVENESKTKRKNWWEVKRKTEVMAIEDLDGSMKKFEKHVAELGVAKKDASGHWQWTGGNKKLVFLGDILGDRGMDGIKITNTVFDLADQAEKMGGQVDFLCGNHEMLFISFLCQYWGANFKIDSKMADRLTDQYVGAWELTQFDFDSKSELSKVEPLIKSGLEIGIVAKKFKKSEEELWPKLYNKMPEILVNMRTNPEGIKILENICKIKVAVVHDDTLLCHTDPTRKMINDLLKEQNLSERVLEINKIFQENLSKAIFNGESFDSEFMKMSNIYLHADNREYFVEKQSIEKCYNNLVNSIIGNLYKKSMLDPRSPLLKEFIEEQVNKGLNWNIKDFDLCVALNKINIDEEILKQNIKDWEKENDIKGDYFNEIYDLFEAIKNKKSDQFYKIEELLLKKITSLNPVNENINKVRNSGINAIIHGHSPRTSRTDNIYYNENDLIIVSPHAYLDKGNSAEKGISTVQKNGRIDLIGKSFRNQKSVSKKA